MKFTKADVEIIKINARDVVTLSLCTVPGKPVDECEFD